MPLGQMPRRTRIPCRRPQPFAFNPDGSPLRRGRPQLRPPRRTAAASNRAAERNGAKTGISISASIRTPRRRCLSICPVTASRRGRAAARRAAAAPRPDAGAVISGAVVAGPSFPGGFPAGPRLPAPCDARAATLPAPSLPRPTSAVRSRRSGIRSRFPRRPKRRRRRGADAAEDSAHPLSLGPPGDGQE